MRVLAIDIGSSSVKAGYWAGRRFAARARVPFQTQFDGVTVEAPAGRVLEAAQRAAREVLHGTSGVDGIAFCALSSAVVVTDQRGRIRAGAITHQDRRSVQEARQLARRLGKKWLLAHTGNLPYPGGIGSSTLAWLRRHQPAVFRGPCRVGQLSSLVGWMLTGEWTIDPSQAVFLGLWDIRRRQWSPRVSQAVGVSVESLPRVVWADQVMGHLTAHAARTLGLRQGTPVLGGFVDASAAVIQTPMKPGQLAHSAGSTDVLAMCVDRPAPGEGILTRPVGVGAGPYPERWLAVRTIAAAGSAVDWARRTLFADLDDKAWRRTLTHACRHPAQAHDVLCVPSFAGERAAIEQPLGATFAGVTLATDRRQLLESIVRGLVCQSAHGYEMLAAIRRPQPTVYAIGGASALRHALHRAWPKRHLFRELQGDSLRGLVELAQHVV